MQSPTRDGGFSTRVRPRLLPVALRDAILLEDQHVAFLLDGGAAIEHALERRRDGQDAPAPSLRPRRIESNDTTCEVDFRPRQLSDFPPSPARVIGEVENVLVWRRK